MADARLLLTRRTTGSAALDSHIAEVVAEHNRGFDEVLALFHEKQKRQQEWRAERRAKIERVKRFAANLEKK